MYMSHSGLADAAFLNVCDMVQLTVCCIRRNINNSSGSHSTINYTSNYSVKAPTTVSKHTLQLSTVHGGTMMVKAPATTALGLLFQALLAWNQAHAQPAAPGMMTPAPNMLGTFYEAWWQSQPSSPGDGANCMYLHF
jgi:hypothetical protein